MRTFQHMAAALLFCATAAGGVAGCASNVEGAGNVDGAGDEGSEDALSIRPITIANWTDHAAIQAVQKVVAGVEAERAAGQLTEAKKTFPQCSFGESSRSKSTNETGKVRRYVGSYGTDDTAGTETLVYDAKGTVRFVTVQTHDVRNNRREVRVYLNERGSRIWEVVRSANDPEATQLARAPFTAVKPQDSAMDNLVIEDAKDPITSFNAKPMCE
jgi:hypothetical protein